VEPNPRLALGGFVVALLIAAPIARAEAAPRPNIVLIYADDVGWGDIGVYGAELIPTPHIDRLAGEGLRFTDAYATAATCTPSRYSLLTGSWAFRNPRASILSGDAKTLIEPGRPTLASVLRDAGYRTSIVGKWHLGLGDGDIDWNEKIEPGPLEIGFDESFIIPATNDRVPCVYVKGHHVANLSGEDDPIRVSYAGPIGDLPTGKSHPHLLRYAADGQHSGTIIGDISRIGFMTGGQSAWWDDEDMAYELTRRSVAFLEENKAGDKPFFLFLSMHENHVPRAPHPDFVGKSKTGLRGDAVVELDWVVGEIVATLDRLDLSENTLVVFTSDNGPVFFDGYEDGALENARDHKASGPFRGGKYQPFEGGTRMPTIASWPTRIEPGGVSSAIISQVDFLATFAALAGAPIPADAAPDSHNFAPALLGDSTEGREHVVQQGAGDLLAIRKGPWKLITGGPEPVWSYQRHTRNDGPLGSERLEDGDYLFNLDDDPGETTNVADAHPQVVEELQQLLRQIRENPEALPR